jgi:hypothetical protein
LQLDGVYESTPSIIENYCRQARAALRALKKLEQREKKKHRITSACITFTYMRDAASMLSCSRSRIKYKGVVE